MVDGTDDLLTRGRTFAPDPDFAARATAGPELAEEAGRRPPRVLGRPGPRARHWERPPTETLDWSDPPFARWFADGALNVAYNCLDRHVRRRQRRPRRAALGGRARRQPRPSPTPSSPREVKRAANLLHHPRRRRGRPGRHLPADDPRGRHRDAGRRAHRRRPLRRLRRLQRREPALAHRRRRGASSSSPPTAAGARARSSRSSPPSTRRWPRTGPRPSSTCSSCRRGENEVDWTEGRDLWWHDEIAAASTPSTRPRPSPPSTPSSSSTRAARPGSRRASCTPRAATSPRPPSRTGTSSTCTPRPTSTGARPTSAGSPATPTSSTARSPTAPRR